MEIYLLKSGACLAIFFTFYKLFLENENMHVFKRFYLLFTTIASFGIPLFTFTKYVEIIPHTNSVLITNSSKIIEQEISAFQDYLPSILVAIYCIMALFFSFRFARNLYKILITIKQNQKQKYATFFHVLLKKEVVPHTFLKYIFLNKQKAEQNLIPKEVLLHEQTHAQQKHSFDILFIEILQIIFWFNPLLYFIKNSIKLNHEFLADQAVLQKGIDSNTYQNILLAFSSKATTPTMANSIYYSFIKKRFTVMKTHTSKNKVWLKSLLLLPLLAILIYGFSTKVEIEKNKSQANLFQTNIQKGASKEQVAIYNKLAKKYNAQPFENRIIQRKDFEKLEFIYRLMTEEQKAIAAPFPECLPPPPPIVSEKPIDHIIRMAKSNAAFFYENKIISSQKAISLLKENSLLNIETTYYKKSNPIVKITKNGNNNSNLNIPPPPPPPPPPKKMEGDSGSIIKNGKTFYYSYKNGITKYYTKNGKEVDRNGNTISTSTTDLKINKPITDPLKKVLELKKQGAIFFIDSKKVEAEEAIKILRKSPFMKIEIKEQNSKTPIINITSNC